MLLELFLAWQAVIPSEECYEKYDDNWCDKHGEQLAEVKPWAEDLTTDEVGGWKIGSQVPTGHGGSYEFTPDIAKAIRQAFPKGDWRWGAALVGCESQGRWDVVSPTNDYGLFQINGIWLRNVPYGNRFSFTTQTNKAAEVYSHQGRAGWACNGVAQGIIQQ